MGAGITPDFEAWEREHGYRERHRSPEEIAIEDLKRRIALLERSWWQRFKDWMYIQIARDKE
jgi:hypothetical protein